jgi:hypothetical protein
VKWEAFPARATSTRDRDRGGRTAPQRRQHVAAPTDILTSVTAGLYTGRHHDPWWHLLPFIGLTLVILAAPSIGVVLLGNGLTSSCRGSATG